MSLFNDNDFDTLANNVNKMQKSMLKRMWPIILLNVVIGLSLLGGGIWLLLYILDTYVGKA